MKKYYVYFLQRQCLVVNANGKREAVTKALEGDGTIIESSFKLRKEDIVNIQEIK